MDDREVVDFNGCFSYCPEFIAGDFEIGVLRPGEVGEVGGSQNVVGSGAVGKTTDIIPNEEATIRDVKLIVANSNTDPGGVIEAASSESVISLLKETPVLGPISGSKFGVFIDVDAAAVGSGEDAWAATIGGEIVDGEGATADLDVWIPFIGVEVATDVFFQTKVITP